MDLGWIGRDVMGGDCIGYMMSPFPLEEMARGAGAAGAGAKSGMRHSVYLSTRLAHMWEFALWFTDPDDED